MNELLKTAITGVNIIPTALLGLIVLYWLIVIIGAIDIDFFDIDVDLDGSEPSSGIINGLFSFLNVAELPFMLVFSILALNFWILSMLIYFLPLPVGGLINGILLIPALSISILTTKAITQPLKKIFRNTYSGHNEGNHIIGHICTLVYNLSDRKLGQADINMEGSWLRINVKAEGDETFKKGEKALVIGKDFEKDFYIISNIKEMD